MSSPVSLLFALALLFQLVQTRAAAKHFAPGRRDARLGPRLATSLAHTVLVPAAAAAAVTLTLALALALAMALAAVAVAAGVRSHARARRLRRFVVARTCLARLHRRRRVPPPATRRVAGRHCVGRGRAAAIAAHRLNASPQLRFFVGTRHAIARLASQQRRVAVPVAHICARRNPRAQLCARQLALDSRCVRLTLQLQVYHL